MIANNIFRAIGEFCTEYAFAIYDVFRFTKGWWTSNAMNVFIFLLAAIALVYWLGEMIKQSNDSKAL